MKPPLKEEAAVLGDALSAVLKSPTDEERTYYGWESKKNAFNANKTGIKIYRKFITSIKNAVLLLTTFIEFLVDIEYSLGRKFTQLNINNHTVSIQLYILYNCTYLLLCLSELFNLSFLSAQSHTFDEDYKMTHTSFLYNLC